MKTRRGRAPAAKSSSCARGNHAGTAAVGEVERAAQAVARRLPLPGAPQGRPVAHQRASELDDDPKVPAEDAIQAARKGSVSLVCPKRPPALSSARRMKAGFRSTTSVPGDGASRIFRMTTR